MKLSRTACYAIQAVVFLAKQAQGQITIGHRAAETLGIPEGFLLRLLVALSRSRILWSIKGPNGGYRLARPAKNISLLEVVEAVEGPVGGAILFIPGAAPDPVDRRLEAVFEHVCQAIRSLLKKVRISDLAR